MLASIVLLTLAAPQGAPVPTVAYSTFGPLPTGEDIDFAGPPVTNQRGGFAVMVELPDSTNAVWGSFDRSPPRFLLQESDLPDGYRLQLISLGADAITYYARHISWSAGDPCREGIVQRGGSQIVCLEANGLPLSGTRLNAIAGMSVPDTGGGLYEFRYSLNSDPMLGRSCVFREGDVQPQLLLGDSIVGATGAITNVLGLNLSPTGAHYGCRVVLDSGGGDYAVVDGAVLQNQGVNVQTGMPIDPSGPAGGPTWFRIFQVAKAASGDWWVHGATEPSMPNQTFLMKNGEIVLSRGDIVDGATISSLESGFGPHFPITEDGSAAYTVRLGVGGFQNRAVWIDGRLALRPGQAVDTDGDGVAELDRLIVRVEGEPVLDADHVIRARVQITDPFHPTVVVAVAMPFGDVVCLGQPNSTGGRAVVEAVGTQLIGERDLTLTARGLPSGVMGLWLTSAETGFLANPADSAGDLCLGGAIGRFTGSVGMSSGAGEFSLDVDLANLPEGVGRVSAEPGETRSFQLWYRDVDLVGGATSNFSSAIAVHAR